jgi:methionyl aminopeptidase
MLQSSTVLPAVLSRIRTGTGRRCAFGSKIQDITRRSLTKSATAAFDDKHTYNDFSFQRDPILPHGLSPTKTVPQHIARPPYAATGQIPMSRYGHTILIHDETSIERMRFAARLARKVLDYACSLAKPGVETDEIDVAVHEAIIDNGAYPSPLNYAEFPKSLCSSINEVICHGIPDARPLQRGDIVSFDVSNFVNGVHGDNCATVIVDDEQEVDEIGVDWRGVPYRTEFDSPEEEASFRAARRLVHATRESLYAAIATCKPGSCLTEVGGAIQDVADEYGYSTVEKYRGHGIGEEFHCAPFVKVCFLYEHEDGCEKGFVLQFCGIKFLTPTRPLSALSQYGYLGATSWHDFYH